MLVLHIRRLGEETLANRVYREQLANQWPGLAKETESICQELGIESVHDTELSVKQYRQVVTDRCHSVNEKRLRGLAVGRNKCDRIMSEPYGKKPI